MIYDNFIYIREHKNYYYDKKNLCKLGKTKNLKERDAVYVTSEIERGKFTNVFHIFNENLDKIEKNLQDNFSSLNFYRNGGKEFFEIEIIDLIESYFIEMGVRFHKLTDDEIDRLIWKTQNNFNKIKPRDYQNEIIDKAIRYFNENDKGYIVATCGVGKTFTSLFISRKLNYRKILIGVPGKLLIEQWEISLIKLGYKNIHKIKSGVNKKKIKKILKENDEVVIITTYHSSNKILNVANNINYWFDIKILDEFHHLTTMDKEKSNDKKCFVKILEINSIKQLSLTATLKEIIPNDINSDEYKNYISNTNIEYFGKEIDSKTFSWAIKNKIICDYQLVTVLPEIDTFNILCDKYQIDNINKRLFNSAYVSLKSLKDNNINHLFIYCNSIEKAKKINDYLGELNKIYQINNLYNNYYGSDIDKNERDKILDDFTNAKNGIICCIYCLGEGFDLPLLDGVVFAENMTSKIRIVQSALRSSRKYKLKKNKINNIILPILNYDLLDEKCKDLITIRNVVHELSMADETIIDKIKSFTIKEVGGKEKNIELIEGEINKEIINDTKLFIRKRASLGVSYKKAKEIISTKKIKNKEKYFSLCEKDGRLPLEPTIFYHKNFISWTDYLSIDRGLYYDLKMCRKKVKYYLKKKLIVYDIEIESTCKKLCVMDKKFPPFNLWVDFYKKDLTEIIENEYESLVDF